MVSGIYVEWLTMGGEEEPGSRDKCTCLSLTLVGRGQLRAKPLDLWRTEIHEKPKRNQ